VEDNIRGGYQRGAFRVTRVARRGIGVGVYMVTRKELGR